MENRKLTSQESSNLVARMIRNSQNRFERGASSAFLIWGYTTTLTSAGIWAALTITGDYRWMWFWFAIPLIGGLCTFITRKSAMKEVVTYIDRMIWQLWIIIGVCAVEVSVFAAFSDKKIPSLLIVSLLIFVGETITGSMMRLAYVCIVGFVGMFLSFGLPYLADSDQILGFAAIFLIAMIIPGHIMKAHARKQNR